MVESSLIAEIATQIGTGIVAVFAAAGISATTRFVRNGRLIKALGGATASDIAEIRKELKNISERLPAGD